MPSESLYTYLISNDMELTDFYDNCIYFDDTEIDYDELIKNNDVSKNIYHKFIKTRNSKILNKLNILFDKSLKDDESIDDKLTDDNISSNSNSDFESESDSEESDDDKKFKIRIVNTHKSNNKFLTK